MMDMALSIGLYLIAATSWYFAGRMGGRLAEHRRWTAAWRKLSDETATNSDLAGMDVLIRLLDAAHPKKGAKPSSLASRWGAKP